MNPEPTGQLIRTDEGRTLLMTRTFQAPIADVWASLTESERTARWIGPWTGEGRVGGTVYVQMTEEEGADPSPGVITACDPPRSLSLDLGSGGEGHSHDEQGKQGPGVACHVGLVGSGMSTGPEEAIRPSSNSNTRCASTERAASGCSARSTS